MQTQDYAQVYWDFCRYTPPMKPPAHHSNRRPVQNITGSHVSSYLSGRPEQDEVYSQVAVRSAAAARPLHVAIVIAALLVAIVTLQTLASAPLEPSTFSTLYHW